MTILQKELTAMNKKVLIVSSSPRKHGNPDLLCDEFARGAKDAGNEVEKVFLADKSINYCRGAEYVILRINAFKRMIWRSLMTKWSKPTL